MTTTANPLLSAENLVFCAGANRLLDQISMHVNAGEVLGIVGPNGAGKSTLLKLLAGIAAPASGSVRLGGRPLCDHLPSSRARMLGYLEQRASVHWPLSVLQVVTLGRLPHGREPAQHAKAIVEAALEQTNTSALQTRSFHTLSEGEKMRVNLARVLATQPRIILADEPTAALDLWHQLQMAELLSMLAARGLGIVVVLHDLGLAARFCNRLLLLDKGRLISCGKPDEVLSTSNFARVWHIDAELAADKFCLISRGRLP